MESPQRRNQPGTRSFFVPHLATRLQASHAQAVCIGFKLLTATAFSGVTDNASVNTHAVKDTNTIVAMSEPVLATYKVDLNSLETISRVEYGNDGVQADMTTAHPVVDPDGTLYNVYFAVSHHMTQPMQMLADAFSSMCFTFIDAHS